MRYIVAVFFGLLISTSVSVAATIDVAADLCFVRESDTTTNAFTMRMQAPGCVLTITNSSATELAVAITIENIDPDFVMVDNYDTSVGFTKSDNTLGFTVNAASGETTVSIQPWHDYDDAFTFVAISDNQAVGTIDANPVFEQLIQDLNVVNPIFYTNSGDLVQGSTDRTTMLQMYEAVYGALDESLSPMYPIAGNHDYGPGLDVFAEYFGGDDYSFEFANTHFVGLSTVGTSSKGEVSEDQLSWLATDLSAAADTTHRIALFHHPLLRPDWATNEYCCYVDTANRDDLAEVIDQSAVDLTIAGHAHGYDYRYITNDDISTVVNGFYQLITGGAGGTIAQPGGENHFTFVSVTADGITPTMLATNDFDTSIDYSQNNGTASSVTAQVVNASDTTVPYIRLKAKLTGQDTSYVVYDNQGNYYDSFYYYNFDDYSVVYAEVDAPANSDVTYTIEPATTFHVDTANTVRSTGNVSYDTYPLTDDSIVEGFYAVPHKQRTTISAISLGESAELYDTSWTETAKSKSINTQYSIGNLPNRRLFEVSVNGEFFQNVGTDDSGQLSFTYRRNIKTRNFSLRLVDRQYFTEVATTPYANGTPQLRRFQTDGNVITSWFGNHSTTVGAYRTLLADVDNNAVTDYIISGGANTLGQVVVYNQNGNIKAQTYPYGDGYLAGITTLRADMNANGTDELITIPDAASGQIKVYTYKNSQLKKLAAKKVFGNAYSGIPAVTVADLNADNRAEIIVARATDTSVVIKVYKLANGKLRLLDRVSLATSASQLALAVGDYSASGYQDIALYTQLTDDDSQVTPVTQLRTYRLNAKRKLKRRATTTLDTSFAGTPAMMSANLKSNSKDALILSSTESPFVQAYTITDSGNAKRIIHSYPFTSSYTGGLNLGITDADDDWTAELVVSQRSDQSAVLVADYSATTKGLTLLATWYPYGSTFSGGTYIAK